MSAEKNRSCRFDEDRRLTPCWPLEECLEAPYGRGVRSRGLVFRSMVNLETGKFSRNIVSVHSGERGKKGFVANFCPFCGHALVETESEEDAA